MTTSGYIEAVACRLNLGAGDEQIAGWIHVDYRPDVADTIADATRLPFASGAAAEIRAMDLLEHFPHDRTQAILGEWRRVLAHAGTLTIKVPNILALARAIIAAPHREAMYVRNVYGGHRWGPDGAWDTHHWAWSPETITHELAQAGFRIVALNDDLNMEVRALRD